MKQIMKPKIISPYLYIVIVRKLSRVSEEIDAAIPSIGDRVNQRSINKAIAMRPPVYNSVRGCHARGILERLNAIND